MNKIFIAADHNGAVLKHKLADFLKRSGYEIVSVGDALQTPEDDYPQFAGRVAAAVVADGDDTARGVLICGSGQGMAMAANRVRGIRAALAWDVREARLARNDEDSNVLCLPARVLSVAQAEAIVMAWLNTPFSGAPRHKRRLQELDELG
jgi:ribose 5-phosphate isomerase B